MMTNRRHLTALNAERKLGRAVHGPALLSAAVAYLHRYAGMHFVFSSRRKSFRKDNWTPRAIEALETAKGIAAPALITTAHLLLAVEVKDCVASQALKKLGVTPSASLGRSGEVPLLASPPEGDLLIQDFAPELRDLQRLASKEARSRKWCYLGTDSLLLVLVKIGVPGVELSYDRVSEFMVEYYKPPEQSKA
jgi:hypothetical protein